MTDSPSQSGVRRGARRWMPVALFVSLAFNLFFAGLILVGPMLFGGPGGRVGPGANMVPSPHMFIEILGPEDGRRVLRELRDEVPDLRDKFRAMREKHRAVIAAMSAEPYEPEALASAFQAVRESHNDFTTSIQKPLVTVMADLTPEQRQKFSDAFKEVARYGGGRPGGLHDGSQGGRGNRDQPGERP